VRNGSGAIHAEGSIAATRFDLDRWMKTLPQPWTGEMEATVFTGGSTITCSHAAALVLAASSLVAAFIPAWRASNVSPTDAYAWNSAGRPQTL
jgi:transposase